MMISYLFYLSFWSFAVLVGASRNNIRIPQIPKDLNSNFKGDFRNYLKDTLVKEFNLPYESLLNSQDIGDRINPSLFAMAQQQQHESFNRTCVNDTDIVYDVYGLPSIIGTFSKCLENVQDIMIAPYFTSHQQMNISTEIELNNLVSIDELSSTVTLDLFFDITWYDFRTSMPNLWSQLDPAVWEYGVDITQATTITNVQGIQPLIWTPDIIFPDASSIYTYNMYIKLYPSGIVRQSTHYIMKLSQPQFYYHNYPHDTQTIVIRYMSYALNTKQLILQPMASTSKNSNPSIDFIYEYGDNDASFSLNPVWKLKSASAMFVDISLNQGWAARSMGISQITVDRRANGVIVRLALPMLFIILLCTMSYWVHPGDRVMMTITGLLAITGLYTAINRSIPFVGYLTKFDIYIISMFSILFFSVLNHLMVLRLNTAVKGDVWPLRKFYTRNLEFIGRILVIPTIIIIYVSMFVSVSPLVLVVTCFFISLYMALICKRYLPLLKSTTEESKVLIQDKIKRNKKLSTIETLFFNFIMFRKIEWRESLDIRNVSPNNPLHLELKEVRKSLGIHTENSPTEGETTTQDISDIINKVVRFEDRKLEDQEFLEDKISNKSSLPDTPSNHKLRRSTMSPFQSKSLASSSSGYY